MPSAESLWPRDVLHLNKSPNPHLTGARPQVPMVSGNLSLAIGKVWEKEAVLSARDTAGATLEEQLPLLIHKLEVAEAEAKWSREEEARRAEIRAVRWEEVKKEAFTKLTYQRNAEILSEQLGRRQEATAMRIYADEVDARADQLDDSEAEEARAWAGWIRQHADRTDPINGTLRLLGVTAASNDELQPHMAGWASYGPYRR